MRLKFLKHLVMGLGALGLGVRAVPLHLDLDFLREGLLQRCLSLIHSDSSCFFWFLVEKSQLAFFLSKLEFLLDLVEGELLLGLLLELLLQKRVWEGERLHLCFVEGNVKFDKKKRGKRSE